MAKVTLPKDVAEALEYATRVHSSLTSVLDDVFNCGGGSDYRMNLLAKHFAGDEKGLMSALVNGYEIEKTPDDKLREYFCELKINRDMACSTHYFEHCEGQMVGVQKTLDILGIKIEGINA